MEDRSDARSCRCRCDHVPVALGTGCGAAAAAQSAFDGCRKSARSSDRRFCNSRSVLGNLGRWTPCRYRQGQGRWMDDLAGARRPSERRWITIRGRRTSVGSSSPIYGSSSASPAAPRHPGASLSLSGVCQIALSRSTSTASSMGELRSISTAYSSRGSTRARSRSRLRRAADGHRARPISAARSDLSSRKSK